MSSHSVVKTWQGRTCTVLVCGRKRRLVLRRVSVVVLLAHLTFIYSATMILENWVWMLNKPKSKLNGPVGCDASSWKLVFLQATGFTCILRLVHLADRQNNRVSFYRYVQTYNWHNATTIFKIDWLIGHRWWSLVETQQQLIIKIQHNCEHGNILKFSAGA